MKKILSQDNYKKMPNGLYARPNTSDEGTWHDVFDEDKAWHRPPEWLKPKTILDLGAYVGYTSFDYATIFPAAAKIIAIEPDPDNYELLYENLYGLSNVKYGNFAVWDYNGYGRLNGAAYNAKKLEKGANIRVTTLDNLFEKNWLDHVDYIKFDIEGAEREILKAGGEWPSKTKCVKVEVHNDYYAKECIQDLKNLGFKKVWQDDKLYHAVVATR